jgi:hypothetical protein
LAKQALKLAFPLGITIEARVEHDGNVPTRGKPTLAQAPAFPDDSPRSIPRDCAGIGFDGNEDRANRLHVIRHDVDSHAFTGKTNAAGKDLLNLRPLSHAIRLGKPLPGDFETSSPQGESVGLLLVGGGELEPPLGAAPLENETAALGLHAGAKAELAGSADFARLIGTLHFPSSLGIGDGEGSLVSIEPTVSADRFDK